MSEVIHYRNRQDQNWPFPMCGKTGLAVRQSEDIEKADCPRCQDIAEKRGYVE